MTVVEGLPKVRHSRLKPWALWLLSKLLNGTAILIPFLTFSCNLILWVFLFFLTEKTDLHQSINSLFNNIADQWKESIPELNSKLLKDLPLSLDSFSIPVNHKFKFRQCSITYRTQPKDFLHQNPYKLSDSTIQSATEYESSDTASEILSSQMDLFATKPVQKKPRLLACKVVANTLKQGRRRSMVTNDCKYLQMKLESLNINYTYLPADNITFTDYPDRSYLWLVSVCSYLIQENKQALHNQVCNLEYLLKLQPYSKSRKASLLNIYQYFKKWRNQWVNESKNVEQGLVKLFWRKRRTWLEMLLCPCGPRQVKY